MEFKVHRTSDWFEKGKPCDEAFEITVYQIAKTKCTSLEEYFAKHGRLFYKDNQVYLNEESGYVEVEVGSGIEWRIEIKSLDELIEFIKKYGECVVSYNEGNEMPAIEIYDAYRE